MSNSILIERQIEEKLKTKIADEVSGCEIVGSWCPSDAGAVKGETDTKAKAVVSIYVSPRSNDSFSLPTVNIDGMIALDARAEMCPTMQEVSEIYVKILDILNTWHNDGQQFSTDMSSDDFFATEIRLTGGDKVSFDRVQGIWTVSIGFTIRGTVIF